MKGYEFFSHIPDENPALRRKLEKELNYIPDDPKHLALEPRMRKLKEQIIVYELYRQRKPGSKIKINFAFGDPEDPEKKVYDYETNCVPPLLIETVDGEREIEVVISSSLSDDKALHVLYSSMR